MWKIIIIIMIDVRKNESNLINWNTNSSNRIIEDVVDYDNYDS